MSTQKITSRKQPPLPQDAQVRTYRCAAVLPLPSPSLSLKPSTTPIGTAGASRTIDPGHRSVGDVPPGRSSSRLTIRDETEYRCHTNGPSGLSTARVRDTAYAITYACHCGQRACVFSRAVVSTLVPTSAPSHLSSRVRLYGFGPLALTMPPYRVAAPEPF